MIKWNKDFKLNFKFGANSVKNDEELQKDRNTSIPKSLKDIMNKVNAKEGYDKRLAVDSKIKGENLGKKLIQANEEIYDYYTGGDNYQDDIPFDLYNMVELARRLAKPYTIPNVSDITKREQLQLVSNAPKKDIKSAASAFTGARIRKDLTVEYNMIENPIKYMNNLKMEEIKGAKSNKLFLMI